MAKGSGTGAEDLKKLEKALGAMDRKDFSTARALLMEVAANAPKNPKDYVYEEKRGNSRSIKFWNLPEFMAYTAYSGIRKGAETTAWVASVYPRALFYLGFIDLERGDYKSAEKALAACLALEPDHPSALCELAMVHKKLGDEKTALKLYEKARTARPYATSEQVATALRGIGSVYVEQNKLDTAEEMFKESLKFAPDSKVAKNELGYIAQLRSGAKAVPGGTIRSGGPPGGSGPAYLGKHYDDSHMKRADELMDKRDFDAALRAATEALQKFPECPQCNATTASILVTLGRFREALKHLEPYSAELDKSPDYFFLRGTCHSYLQNLDCATSDFNRSLELRPGYQPAFQMLGNSALDCGFYKEAIMNFREALEIGPDKPSLHSLLGIAYACQLELKKAAAEFEKASAFKGARETDSSYIEMAKYYLGLVQGCLKDDVIGRVYLALELRDRGHEGAALKLSERDAKANPDAVGPGYYYTSFLLDSGEVGKARKLVGKFLKDLKRDERAYQFYALQARLNVIDGEHGKAIESADKDLAKFPNHSDAYFYKALAHHNKREYSSSAREAKLALERRGPFPALYCACNIPWVHAVLGEAYVELKMYGDATQALTYAISRGPARAYNYLNRGAAYQRLGKSSEALDDYAIASNLDESGEYKETIKGNIEKMKGGPGLFGGIRWF